MNRHVRRLAELQKKRAAARGQAPPLECVFESEPDPERPGYAWFNILLPAPGMPQAAYAGDEAVERFRRFVAGFAQGQAEALLEGRRLVPVELAALDALVADARRAPPGAAVAMQARAWMLTLAHARPDPAAAVEWVLVAQLYPRGRGSRDATWADLGKLVAAVAARTDGPAEPPPTPPSVAADANAPHRFAWPVGPTG